MGGVRDRTARETSAFVFCLSYSLFQPLQIFRIRVRKSLIKILDHCVQIRLMNRLLFHLLVPLAY